MFRKWMQWLLQKPVTRLAEKISSAPDKGEVFTSLDALLEKIRGGNRREGLVVPFDHPSDRFIIFSDQHKGCGDLADDFRLSEKNYLAALDYYYENNFCFINLGDAEELWKNNPDAAIKYNRSVLESEARFLQQKNYYRVYGNHDLEWKFPFQRNRFLRPVFGKKLNVYQGIELQAQYNQKTWSVFLTHGHQGDKRSDGNKFSIWVVAAIWTHKPVFASLDHIDRLNYQLEQAQKTGDTAAEGFIRLVRWKPDENGNITRKVLEEAPLTYIFERLLKKD